MKVFKNNLMFADQRAGAWMETAFSWSLCSHLALCNISVNIRMWLKQSFNFFMRKPDQRDMLECVHYTNVMGFLMYISTGHYHCLEYCTNYNENDSTATFSNQRCMTPAELKRKYCLSDQPAGHLTLVSNFIVWEGLAIIEVHPHWNKWHWTQGNWLQMEGALS